MASIRERILDLRFKQPAEWTRTPSDFFVPEWLKTESMSHHPFVRDPAPADWRRIVKTRVTNLAMYVFLLFFSLKFFLYRIFLWLRLSASLVLVLSVGLVFKEVVDIDVDVDRLHSLTYVPRTFL